MKIRTATLTDAPAMHQLHGKAVRITCKGFYTQEQINAWLEGRSPEGYHKGINQGDMYVAEDEGKIIGFGHAVAGEILAIFVDSDSQKKGVGKALLEYGLKIALKGHSKVKLMSTVNAENFYRKYGFIKIKDGVHVRNGVSAPVVMMEYLSIQNPWDTLSEKFNANKETDEIDPDAADNILIAWPVMVEQIEKHFKGKKNLSILDYGCGTGTFCEKLRAHGYKKITGIDSSKAMIDLAKKHYGKGIHFVHQAAELPLDIEPQDMILSSMVFQFIEEIELTFQNLHNILKPGGLFIFAVHNPAMIRAGLQRKLKIFTDFNSIEKPERGMIHLGKNSIPIFIRTGAEYDSIMRTFGFNKIFEAKPPFSPTFISTYHPEIPDISNFLILGYEKSAE